MFRVCRYNVLLVVRAPCFMVHGRQTTVAYPSLSHHCDVTYYQGSQVITIVDIPVPIHLPVGLTKATLARWRDSLSYVVVGKILRHRLLRTALSSSTLRVW
jgi:hypothetical protein